MRDWPPEISFTPDMALLVSHELKRQTLRRKARCQPGDPLRLCRPDRVPLCPDVTCRDVTPVRLTAVAVRIPDDAPADIPRGIEALARADGFTDFAALRRFLTATYGPLPLDLYLIRW